MTDNNTWPRGLTESVNAKPRHRGNRKSWTYFLRKILTGNRRSNARHWSGVTR